MIYLKKIGVKLKKGNYKLKPNNKKNGSIKYKKDNKLFLKKVKKRLGYFSKGCSKNKNLQMNTINLVKKIRFEIINMSYRSKAPHLASSLSCTDIVTVLYEKILKINKKNRI